MNTEIFRHPKTALSDYSLPAREADDHWRAQTLEDMSAMLRRSFPLLNGAERIREVFSISDQPILVTTSGGIQSARLLAYLAEVREGERDSVIRDRLRAVPIAFLDTGDIFPETLEYLNYLEGALDLKIQRYRHGLAATDFARNMELLMEAGLSRIDAFDELTKVRPMRQILKDLNIGIWISGNRRDQSASRSDLPFAELKNGVLKVYPLADTLGSELAAFLNARGLVPHPLSNVYRSVGNKSDTVEAGEGYEKAGRHGGVKEECGLHLGWVKRGKTLVTVGGLTRAVDDMPVEEESIHGEKS